MIAATLAQNPRTAVQPRSEPSPKIPPSAFAPVLRFGTGETVFPNVEGEDQLYEVLFGIVRLYHIHCDGQRQVCDFLFSGDVFGLLDQGRQGFQADTLAPTGLRALPCGKGDDCNAARLFLAASLLRRTNDHLVTLTRQSAVERVTTFLIEMAERQSPGNRGVVRLPMMRGDIADYLGLTVETVSRVLTKLRRSGLIQMADPHRIALTRPEALRAYCR